MNKEELLKAIEQKRQAIWPTDTGKMAPATVPNNLEQGWLNALKWMEDFINSLPVEQPSEDLEEEIKRKYKSNNALMMPIEDFRKLIHHFTDWQKEQMMKSAVDATCVLLPPPDVFKVLICHEVTDKLTVGQKVKVIIVKEDEQCSTE